MCARLLDENHYFFSSVSRAHSHIPIFTLHFFIVVSILPLSPSSLSPLLLAFLCVHNWTRATPNMAAIENTCNFTTSRQIHTEFCTNERKKSAFLLYSSLSLFALLQSSHAVVSFNCHHSGNGNYYHCGNSSEADRNDCEMYPTECNCV